MLTGRPLPELEDSSQLPSDVRNREFFVFTVATGLAILHVLDHAFIGKQPGTTAGDRLLGSS
jgi:hypothetical protein